MMYDVDFLSYHFSYATVYKKHKKQMKIFYFQNKKKLNFKELFCSLLLYLDADNKRIYDTYHLPLC